MEVKGQRVIQSQEKYGKIGNKRNRHQNERRRAVGNEHHAADDRQQSANSKSVKYGNTTCLEWGENEYHQR